MKYWEIIADNLSKAGLELELGLNKCQILKKKSLRKVLTFFAVPM